MAMSSILIVDSDSELAQIVASFLNFQGHRVHYTARVREAATKLALQKYHYLIIDPDLPGEEGADVLRAGLDPASLNTKTPVILTCRNTSYELPLDSVHNVRVVLPKPFTIDDIYGALLTTDVPSVSDKTS